MKILCINPIYSASVMGYEVFSKGVLYDAVVTGKFVNAKDNFGFYTCISYGEDWREHPMFKDYFVIIEE
jgi:hypothetical protein